MFYLNSTLDFGIPPVLLFQFEVYCKVDRLLNGLTAQQKGTTARWYSNKTSLLEKYSKKNSIQYLKLDWSKEICIAFIGWSLMLETFPSLILNNCLWLPIIGVDLLSLAIYFHLHKSRKKAINQILILWKIY